MTEPIILLIIQFAVTCKLTHSFLKVFDVWVIRRSVPEDFSQQQRVLHQP